LKKIIRYIGSKEKLLPFLNETIFKNYKNKNIKFLDAFAGTTVISKYLQDNYKFDQYLSDFSDYTEILASRLFITLCSENIEFHIQKIFDISNSLEKTEAGIIYQEFSIGGTPNNLDVNLLENQSVKSRMFFSSDVGIKIDTMRAYIANEYNKKNINEYDKNLLLMIMLAFADKNANTTSVYGAYLKKQNRETIGLQDTFLDILKIDKKTKPEPPKKFFKGDILKTLEEIPPMDVIYYDPPYNTRKYESNYHILNYLSNLDFKVSDIKENSKTGLPKNKINNKFGSKKDTRIIFNDIIVKGIEKSENVFISYSSESEMKHDEIQEICNNHNLELNTYSQDYKKYKSKKINQDKSLKELVYHIKRN
jgi:adenine-specific DNA-methyltransferase